MRNKIYVLTRKYILENTPFLYWIHKNYIRRNIIEIENMRFLIINIAKCVKYSNKVPITPQHK